MDNELPTTVAGWLHRCDQKFAEGYEKGRASAATAVPKGWRLAPEVPTQQMCQEGQWKAQEWPKFPLRIVPIWQAMLAASPTTPKD